MPPFRNDASDATIRKRESRARFRAAGEAAYLAQEATRAKAYRTMVKARKQADLVVIPDGVDRPEYLNKINTMRADLSEDIAKIISDNLAINADEDRILAMKPIIQTRVQAKAKLVKLSMDLATQDSELATRVKTYSDAEFEAGLMVKPIKLDTFKTYIKRVSLLQELLTGDDKAPVDMRNFVDSTRMMKIINTARVNRGENVGQLWSLNTRVGVHCGNREFKWQIYRA